MTVGHGRDGVDVGHGAVRVAQGLYEQGFGVGRDGFFKVFRVGRVDEGGFYPIHGKCVVEEVVGTSIDIVGGHDMVADGSDIQQCIRNCRGSACNSQGCRAPFEGGYALLQDCLGAVGQAPIDVALLFEVEPVGGLPAICEHV